MTTIYRGFDIEQVNGIFLVTRDGKTHVFNTEDTAMSAIDTWKREEREKHS